MKNWFYILFIFFSANIGFSQCPNTVIILESQSEIDDFAQQYPGCTDFNFSLRVGGESAEDESDIFNLAGLSSIKTTKSFIIQYAPLLQNLKGLEGLRRATGLFIRNNELLSDVSDLQSLDSCYSLNIISNPELQNLDFLSQLSNLGQFILDGNKTIKDISDLPIITNLVALTINNCDSLTSLNGIEEHDNIFSVRLMDNKNLLDLVGLNTLGKLDRIRMEGLESLTNFNDLAGIDSLFSLVIKTMPGITDLKGLESLESVFSFYIGDNANLESISALYNYQSKHKETNIYDGGLAPGSLTILDNPSLVNLSGLSNLTSIRDLQIENNDKLKDLTGLEDLEEVQGGFVIRDNDNITSLDGYTHDNFDSYYAWEDCYGPVNYKWYFINNNASLESIEIFSGESFVNADIHISNNDKLANLNGFESIRDVYGTLRIINNIALDDLSRLSNLESVLNGFSIIGSPMLTNLTGLSNLEFDRFVSLTISENTNLTTLNGLNKPEQLSNLILSDNERLSNISALADLTSIKSLTMNNNDMIENLDVFGNVTSSIHKLEIQGNDILNDISGLNGIQSIDEFDCYGNTESGILEINSNPLLSDCAIMPICDALVSPKVNVNIANNGNGCNSPEDLNCDEVSISGFVFYDENQNGILDAGENGISNIGVNMDPPDRRNLTKPGGKYFQVCQEGTEYNITFPGLDNYNLTTTDNYTITFQPGNSINYNNNFGIYPNTLEHDLVSNISSFSTRCNREVDFFLSIENIGTYVEDGILRVDFDPLSTYISSIVEPDSINIDSSFLLWEISDFAPFDLEQFVLLFDMPDETFTGTILNFTSSFISDEMGTETILGEFTYSPTVLCSYDPNDKLVMPAGMYDENYTLKGDKLTYTVRFQNTGNASAIDVTIIDTISDLLDIETFRIVNSSFTPITSIDDREVTFFFKDINLIDSLTNERESHGFVTFEIEPIGDISDYSEIRNKADIIFDSNAPIITNTVLNTMVTNFPTSTNEESTLNHFIIYPNPTTGSKSIFVDYEFGDEQSITTVAIYDCFGRELTSEIVTNGINEISIRDMRSGIYFIILKQGNHIRKVSKVVVAK